MMKPLESLVRPNIWSLEPYSCARDEFKGRDAHNFLDANESPYNTPYNRYPDPLQEEVKGRLSKIKQVPAENIFLGNGSDEAIDLIYRVFCRPGIDNVVAIAPTYGMYQVCANINDVEYRSVLLEKGFKLNASALLNACDENTKAIFICSPNNPTGNDMDREEVKKVILHFPGIVVIDEAYSDFSQLEPMRLIVGQVPNLVVLNTFSKAWGSASIRLGMAYASREIINIFNRVKYPYNVNLLTQEKALEIMSDMGQVNRWVSTTLQERTQMAVALANLPICKKVHPSDANFILCEVTDANAIYQYLIDNGIVVRNRTRVQLCHNCLRITVGTKAENCELLRALIQYGKV